MRHLTLIGSAILLASCATTTANYKQNLQSWSGATTQEVVQRWGKPDTFSRTAQGQTLLVYRKERASNMTTPTSPAVGVSINREGRIVMTTVQNTNMTWNRGSMSLVCTTAFVANTKGIITDVDAKGPGCYGNDTITR